MINRKEHHQKIKLSLCLLQQAPLIHQNMEGGKVCTFQKVASMLVTKMGRQHLADEAEIYLQIVLYLTWEQEKTRFDSPTNNSSIYICCKLI